MAELPATHLDELKAYIESLRNYRSSGDPFKEEQAQAETLKQLKPTIAALIDYYFTLVFPLERETIDEGDNSKTREEVLVNSLGYFRTFTGVLDLNSTHQLGLWPVLNTAMQHYEERLTLSCALLTPVSSMTGGQLLLLLREVNK